MGPGETIGLIAVVVLGIVFVGMAFSAYERRLKFKERKLELEARIAEAAVAARSSDTGREVEERMRVLERIVTDKGYDVAHQIEALRDARRTEALLEAHDAKVS